MAQVKFKGTPVNTKGNLPTRESQAPDFKLVATDLSVKTLSDFKGSKVILNIFHSLDTGTCANSVRKFNEEAASLNNVKVLCISKDLPFAHSRFCETEGIKNLINLSEYRDTNFSDAYGVTYTDNIVEGLMSRAIVVIDEQGKVVYTEQVIETSEEPDYEKALAALK